MKFRGSYKALYQTCDCVEIDNRFLKARCGAFSKIHVMIKYTKIAQYPRASRKIPNL